MNKDILNKYFSDYTKECVCLHDPTGRIREVGNSVERVLGYTSEEMTDKNIYEFLHEEDRDFFELNVHQPLLSGHHQSMSTDARFRKKHGGFAWLNVDVVATYDSNGVISGIISISRDISDFMAMKAKYEKKETLLSNTGQMAQLGAWEFDVATGKRVWSKETYDIYEVTETTKPTFEEIFTFFPGEAGKVVRAAFDSALNNGIPFDLNVPFQSAKGKKIWVRVMATPKIHLGKVVRVVGVIQNIDKEVNASMVLKSMVRQLTKQNRQLEDFTHILSHNVRGPISSLTTLLSMLEVAETDEERAELMGMLKMSSQSLENLLVELKEVISATHVRGVESQENELTKIIAYSKELLNGDIMQTHATIVEKLDGWQTIFYPRIYLESIVMNMLSNALKYRDDQRDPVITIETENKDGLYVLKFTDNGCGIDLQKHGANMFKLYKTFHPAKPGKGLGLFMTKSQIEAMGGELTVESEPGVGTTFTIIFNKEKPAALNEAILEDVAF